MNKEYRFQGREFSLENFADKPPFCDFLPGIAGLEGRPLWAFFCNRGQGIAGFGVRGKENPIMEFYPAEIAYAQAPRQGFRTFLRIDGKYCEPFEVLGGNKTRMRVRRSGFGLEETCPSYTFSADYFGVPNRDYAALGRIVRYTNRTDKTQTVELLDGLATILPFGLSSAAYKETGNLFKSWMCVSGISKGYGYYKMRASTADSSEVSEVRGGNFFVAVSDACSIRTVADAKAVFGEDTTKTKALVFEKEGVSDASFTAQSTENEVACAFANGTVRVPAGETVTLCELFGFADSEERVARLQRSLTVQEVERMQQEADEEAEKIALLADTHTAYPLFDEYIKQSYFDNVLRGGMPCTLGNKTYYVFSRKHGDPERDYNAFSIEPQPYSCGAGNFRDVAQNRRNDLFFTPQCGDFNVRYFFSLLQLDGYNPLCVGGMKYRYKGSVPQAYKAHEAFLGGAFTVGELCEKIGTASKAEISEILGACEELPQAAFGEGYWTDHFVYLIDLVTAYLAVYPESRDELLYKTSYKWFASRAHVLPRCEKTVLRADGQVRRYGSVEEDGKDGWAENADGTAFTTTLAAKLLFLAVIKTATLDPLGCGIDMEADKPGWNDATNGLPSTFGSNVADAQELYRLLQVLRDLLGAQDVEWSKEQNDLFTNLLRLLRLHASPLSYYEQSNEIKENYRAKIYAPLSGKRAKVSRADIADFLGLASDRVQEGLERAASLADGWMPTYLRFTAEEYEVLQEDGKPKTRKGLPCVKVKTFSVHALPHFAEGVAKGITNGRKELYAKAKTSDLYDKPLGVFRTSEPLDGESMEIGRIRSFSAGWLERESCFLHMHYKVLLSLLTAGMYEAFYEEIRTGLVPNMDVERYGRSPIENSSFIVTSNHIDKRKWGKGFQARLTGANAEVLSMWRIMMGLEKPFTFEGGTLRFALSPKLARDFFDEDGIASFTLFGKTKITYVNKTGQDAYRLKSTAYTLTDENGKTTTVREVTGDTAEAVRQGKYKTIEVQLQ